MQTLTCNGLSVTIDERGAELVSVIKDGKERLWQNENGAWAGHAPVLFPVCGHCGVVADGREYPMPTHGFARKATFRHLAGGKNACAFVLESNAETRAVYPFEFRLTIEYTIVDGGIVIGTTVRNTGEKELPFFLGAHPSFALDGNVGDYKIIFEKEECLIHHAHDEGGYLTGETTDYGTRREFPLPEDYLQAGRTLIFPNIKSRKVMLVRGNEGLAVYSFDGFSHLLLWRAEGANMICIEPWGNLPDLRGDNTELAQKQGVTLLKKGEERTFMQRILYH